MMGSVGLWAAVSAIVFGVSTQPERVPLKNVRGPGERAESVGATADQADGANPAGASKLKVNVALFELERSQRSQSYPAPRNIFLAPTAGGGMSPSAAMGQLGLQGQVADADEVDADESDAATSALRYVGFVTLGESAQGTTAAQAAKGVGVAMVGDQIHMVRAGDRIADRYRVVRVAQDLLTVADRTDGRELRVPITEVTPTD
ncbi:MAG: hypothetical protein U0172_01285 [Nitrospiraceae bacterium]